MLYGNIKYVFLKNNFKGSDWIRIRNDNNKNLAAIVAEGHSAR